MLTGSATAATRAARRRRPGRRAAAACRGSRQGLAAGAARAGAARRRSGDPGRRPRAATGRGCAMRSCGRWPTTPTCAGSRPGGALEPLVVAVRIVRRRAERSRRSRGQSTRSGAVIWSALATSSRGPDADQVVRARRAADARDRLVRTAAMRRAAGALDGESAEPAPLEHGSASSTVPDAIRLHRRPSQGSTGPARIAERGPAAGPRCRAAAPPRAQRVALDGGRSSRAGAAVPGRDLTSPRRTRCGSARSTTRSRAAERSGSPLSLLLVELEDADRVLAAERPADAARHLRPLRPGGAQRCPASDILACETDARAWVIARDTRDRARGHSPSGSSARSAEASRGGARRSTVSSARGARRGRP